MREYSETEKWGKKSCWKSLSLFHSVDERWVMSKSWEKEGKQIKIIIIPNWNHVLVSDYSWKWLYSESDGNDTYKYTHIDIYVFGRHELGRRYEEKGKWCEQLWTANISFHEMWLFVTQEPNSLLLPSLLLLPYKFPLPWFHLYVQHVSSHWLSSYHFHPKLSFCCVLSCNVPYIFTLSLSLSF